MEAIIGAVYLDAGLKIAEKVIIKLMEEFSENSILPIIDAKTQIQEYSLKKYKKLPKYTFINLADQHKPTFKVNIEIPNSKKF